MSRVVHFEMTSDDPARASKFYAEVFGWKIATWGGPQSYWLVTTGPDGQPGINGAFMGRHLPQPVINTVQVDSLADATARIEQAGGKRVHGPNQIPNVGTHAYFSDPDGTLFGVLEPARGA